jgi:hypothetical protein
LWWKVQEAQQLLEDCISGHTADAFGFICISKFQSIVEGESQLICISYFDWVPGALLGGCYALLMVARVMWWLRCT